MEWLFLTDYNFKLDETKQSRILTSSIIVSKISGYNDISLISDIGKS